MIEPAELMYGFTDRPLPSRAQQQRQLWNTRFTALQVAFSGGSLTDDQLLGRDQADAAYVRRLRSGLERGVRCDTTSTCVPFDFEPEDVPRLEQAQQAEDRAWDELERLQNLLNEPVPNYKVAAQTHDVAISAMNEAFALTALIRARPVEQPRSTSSIWMWGLGVACLFGIGISARRFRS